MLYANRGYAWSLLGDLEKAISDFNEAARLDPNDAANFSIRGTTWCMLDELDNAIKWHERAIEMATEEKDKQGGRDLLEL